MNGLITAYIVLARPTLLKKDHDTSAMFLNSWGRPWKSDNLLKTYNQLGAQYLGIKHFGPNILRTLILSLRLKDGIIAEHNVEQVASLLQTSTDTIRTNYMGSVHTPAMAQLSTSLWEASDNCPDQGTKRSHEAAFAETKQKPSGGPAAIKRARERWSEGVRAWKEQQKSEGFTIAEAWGALCDKYPERKREGAELPADIEWSKWSNTYLEDGKPGLKALREKMT
jgi:hypothetical protein